MAYDPAVRTEAYELYLLGNSPAEIAKELSRRHPEQDTPSAKTLEKWAYTPTDGKTWSERRYEAEASSMEAATSDFVSMRSSLVSGTLRIQQRLQERVERALDNADDAEVENLTQEVYALLNATKSVAKMLDNQLAEDARKRDAIDQLLEACRRIVPGWDNLQARVHQEFRRLTAQ